MQMEAPPEVECFIVNDGGRVSYPAGVIGKVLSLKAKIKLLAPDSVPCNTDKLRLYLARRNNEWLSLKEAEALELDSNGMIVDKQTRLVQSFTLLDQEGKLKDELEGLALEEGEIHVLVVVPTKPARAAPEPDEETVAAAKRLKVGGDEWPTLRDAAQQVANIGVTLNCKTDLAVGERLTNLPAVGLRVILKSGLYVRQEYWEVYDIIQSYVSPESVSRILVVGSPGIGKSTFGIFLLLVLLTERKNVAYRPLDQHTVWFFTWNGEEYDVSDEPVAGKTYDGLFDGEESRGILDDILFRHAYLFATPRDSNYHYFKKEKCSKVVMNPWTKEECQSFADALELETHHEWLSRFNLVGGNPRSLFLSCESFDELFDCVERCVPDSIEMLKKLAREIRLGRSDDDSTPILFSFYRREGNFFLAYSSLAVETIVSAKFNIPSADDVRSLILPRWESPAPILKWWRGKQVETVLLQDLATSKFVVRSLDEHSAETERELGPLNAAFRIIRASSDIQNELMLNIPASEAFASIDGGLVAPSDKLIIYVQATVSRAYPIVYQHLESVYEDLTKRAAFQNYEHFLLFIVPPSSYNRFTAQPYFIGDKEKERTLSIDNKIPQYVGQIVAAPADEEKSLYQPEDEKAVCESDAEKKSERDVAEENQVV